MTAFIVKRLLQTLPLLVLISMVVFLMLQMTPGGPLAMDDAAVGRATAEQLERARARYGLDDPMHVQYLRWARDLMRGDLGMSIPAGRPVATMIMERVPTTLMLTTTALVITLLLAFPIGIVSAVRQYSAFDYLTTTFAFLGIAVPRFWFAIMMLYVFTFWLGWLPAVGLRDPRRELEGFEAFLDLARHMVMPVASLAVVSVAGLTRYVRASMLEVLQQDYIRTARSKGISEVRVIVVHALKNGAIPVVTILVLEIPQLFLSSVVVETIFGIAGIGRLFIQSAHAADYQVLMGIVVIGSLLIVFANLLADVLYAVLDPRIRY